MKICNKTGCAVCVDCDGVPPSTNGYSHGDICRKTVENIMNYLEDEGVYTFSRGKLYRLNVYGTTILDEEECDI